MLGLLLVAVAISMLEGVAKKLSEDVQGALDWEPYGVGFLFGAVIPLAAHAAIFVLLMRGLPQQPVAARGPGRRGAGALGFQAVQAVLSWYLAGPANFSAIYGSASAIFAFLLSIYLGATAFVGSRRADSRPRRPGEPCARCRVASR